MRHSTTTWVSRTAGVLAALAAFNACQSIAYKDDIGFLVSAQANSPEFPAYVNGHLCVDMDGLPGVCSKRIRSDEDLVLRFDPQGYVYTLTLTCSSGMPARPSVTVPANTSHVEMIKPSEFIQFRSFSCIGEVGPQDRQPPISAKFRVNVTVTDAAYVGMDRIFHGNVDGKNVLVIGQYARAAWVFDQGKWTRYDKATAVEVRDPPEKLKAYSQSFAMRFNYFNMGASDAGIP